MADKKIKTTEFFDYDPSWETEAEKTINQLKNIFGGKAPDIQHIGGTAMKKIKSKPIIDIVVGIADLNIVYSFKDLLKTHGFVCDYKKIKIDSDRKLFFKYSEKNHKTHIVHIVRHNSRLWFEYIIFRDHMNSNDNKAREYETLKLSVNGKYKYALPSYIKTKSDFIFKIVTDHFYTTMLGKNITVKLNRETSENYPNFNDGIYPLNCGYIENLIINEDNKDKIQDAYVIGGADYKMADEFNGKIIAFISRNTVNGLHKSFIVAKENMIYYKPDISEAVKFYFNNNSINSINSDYSDSAVSVVCLYEKSCGAVVYTNDTDDDENDIKFLLVKGSASNRVGFPKGHIEKGETEAETAIREVYEETSLNVILYSDFKEEYSYPISGYIKKSVVYFLAEFNSRDKYKIRDNEILEQWLLPYDKAYELLTFAQDKIILKKAYEKIKNIS